MCSRTTSLNDLAVLQDFGSRQIKNWWSEELIDELDRLVVRLTNGRRNKGWVMFRERRGWDEARDYCYNGECETK